MLGARVLEKLGTSLRVVDNFGQLLNRGLHLESRGKLPVEFREQIGWACLIGCKRPPNLFPSLGPDSNELSPHGCRSPANARLCKQASSVSSCDFELS